MPKNSSPATDSNTGYWPDLLEAAANRYIPVSERLTRLDARARHTPGRPAGVLIAIDSTFEPAIYFTQRGTALTHHPGQISFPGGRLESGDADLACAALREAKEEIGLASSRVCLLGALPRYQTVTGFDISPFIGWIEPDTPVRADGVEVERIFKIPLAFAMTASHYRTHRRVVDNVDYRIYSIDFDGDRVWGATAGILIDLAYRVAQVQGQDFELAEPEPGDTLD